MAIDLTSIKKTKTLKETIDVIYGTSGIGKTTACAIERSIWIQTEQGEGLLELDAFPLVKKYEQVKEYIAALAESDHAYKLLVIDSLDHLEPLLWEYTCEKNKIKNIEEPGYGKGYAYALDEWRSLIKWLNALRDKKKMNICLIGHSAEITVNRPDGDSFHKTNLKLHKGAAAFIAESADCVFYAEPEITVRTKEQSFGRKQQVGKNTGNRIMNTVGTPHFVAKNRYNLPEQIDLSYSVYKLEVEKQKAKLSQPKPTQKKEA